VAGSIPSSPCNHVPPNQVGQHPTERPRGSSHGLGTHGEAATSRWQWLRVLQGRSTALELGQGLVSPDRYSGCTHGALTRSLVFDEEELQPLLEGVFIHVELDLHPAGKAPRGARQWGRRLDPEPPRSPITPSQLGHPQEQPRADAGLSPLCQITSTTSREHHEVAQR